MTKPTAKALRATLASKKPALTQAQKDKASLEKKLADVPKFYPIDGKRTSKDACIAAANESAITAESAIISLVTVRHELDIEIREHKATKKALAAAQKEIKKLKA